MNITVRTVVLNMAQEIVKHGKRNAMAVGNLDILSNAVTLIEERRKSTW